MLGTGKIGVVTDNTNAVFDDFKFFRPTPYDPAVPGWNTSSAVTLTTGSPGYLTVTGQTRGGEVVSTWCGDDDYAAQADLSFVSGNRVALLVRYIDPDNFMGVELRDNGTVNLIKMLDGRQTTVASGSYSGSSPYTTYVRCSGSSYVVRVEGTQAISTTDADIAHGTVGLWAERSGKFETVKAGVDSAPDGDLDDTADTLVIYDTFTGTSKAFAYDDAGNLVEDDRHRYQYDAWNRLVLVQRIAADANGTDATTLHAAEYDGLGRRIEKVVSNCGDLDGTFRYGYNGQQMIERRDGSSNVLTQAYYGTQYIDELVALKLEHGYAVVSQDANYNVTTLTDLAGRVLERVFTTEYGQPILESDSYFGDYDADGDVDATDDSYLGSGQTCWGTATGACRVFDFNGDGTLDASDETVMTALVSAPTTNRVHHARRTSPTGNVFLHQGLVYDAEIGGYQNRAREYDPAQQRFLQRDPDTFRESSNHYQYCKSNPKILTDASGRLSIPISIVPMCLALHCHGLPWEDKCTGPCARFWAPPYPPSGPNGSNCNYPNRRVCHWTGQCWESQCVCQCAGNSPGLNCIRACIRCADNSGAPDKPSTEKHCQRNCNLTLNELSRLNCCLNQDYSKGGCSSSLPGMTPPMNPNPGNTTCTTMPIP